MVRVVCISYNVDGNVGDNVDVDDDDDNDEDDDDAGDGDDDDNGNRSRGRNDVENYDEKDHNSECCR